MMRVILSPVIVRDFQKLFSTTTRIFENKDTINYSSAVIPAVDVMRLKLVAKQLFNFEKYLYDFYNFFFFMFDNPDLKLKTIFKHIIK